MNNSHEELKRRLASMEAPEPPADLLDRIRGEIPEELPVAPPTRRFGFPAAAMRIAASLILVIGAAWFAVRYAGSEKTDIAPAGDSVVTGGPASPVGPPPAPRPAGEGEQMVLRGEGAAEGERPPAGYADAAGIDAVPPVAFGAPPSVRREAVSPAAKSEAAAPSSDAIAVTAAPFPPPPAPPAPAPREQIQKSVASAAVAHESAARSPRRQETAERGMESDARSRVVGGVIGQRIMQPGIAPAPLPRPSTGGTAEPNGRPWGDVFFRPYGANPFVDTEDDRFSTFGIDVDTASYAIVRRYLRDGHLPPPEAVRAEEIVNYFDYGDRAPARGDFALYAEAAPSPFPPGERYAVVRFGIAAREVSRAARRPAVLTFVVDVSGSMQRENRLELVKKSLSLLVREMKPDDRIGLVVFGSDARVILEPTTSHEAILDAISSLRAEGSTNAEDGLRLGYRMASRHRRQGAINRVILCSDGVANVGRTSAESLLAMITEHLRDGIELTTVGFGMGNYNDELMEQLANRGNGNYAYVDTLDEARRVFVENLTGLLQTVARDAKVQVEFNPAIVARYRLVGYENRDIADHRFRDDTVDAGEVGAGHRVTALYEVKLQRDLRPGDRIAALRVRYASVAEGGEVREIGRWLAFDGYSPAWDRAPRSLRLASMAGAFAELLRGSYWARTIDPPALARSLTRLAQESGDARVRELASLAGEVTRLQGPRPEPPPEPPTDWQE
jgi:uncharacterized protein YegL